MHTIRRSYFFQGDTVSIVLVSSVRPGSVPTCSGTLPRHWQAAGAQHSTVQRPTRRLSESHKPGFLSCAHVGARA